MPEPLSDEVAAELHEIISTQCRRVTTGDLIGLSIRRAAEAAYRLGLAHRSEPADYALWRAERAESAAAQRRHDEGMKFADDSGRKLASKGE
jgi:hypothetical protein